MSALLDLEYTKLCNSSPMKIDWSRLSEYELEDNTDLVRRLLVPQMVAR
jgi:hypothetical protein